LQGLRDEGPCDCEGQTKHGERQTAEAESVPSAGFGNDTIAGGGRSLDSHVNLFIGLTTKLSGPARREKAS
jgi:hypothetical protein